MLVRTVFIDAGMQSPFGEETLFVGASVETNKGVRRLGE